jgi:hypothetical protein
MLKSKEKTCMVEEPSHVKKLSLNHMFQIGLNDLVERNNKSKTGIIYSFMCGLV